MRFRLFLLTFCSRGVAALGNTVLLASVGQMTGSAGLAAFSVGLSIALGLGTIGRFGTDTALLRYGSLASARLDMTGYRRLVARLRWITLSISVPLAALIFAMAPVIAVRVFAEAGMIGTVRAAALISPFVPLIFLQSAGFKVLRLPQLVPLAEMGGAAFVAALLLLGRAVATGAAADATTALSALGLAVVLSLVAGALIQRARINADAAQVGDAVPAAPVGGLFGKLPNYAVPALILYGTNWGVLLFVGSFASDDEIALFAVSLRLMLLVNVASTVILTVIVSGFAPLHSEGRTAELSRLSRRAAFAGLGFALPIALLICVAPQRIIAVFGIELADGYLVLFLLVSAQVMNAAFGPVGALLYAAGHAARMRMVVTCVGLPALPLAYPVISAFGVLGAAALVFGVVVLQNGLAAILVRRHVGFWVYPVWAR